MEQKDIFICHAGEDKDEIVRPMVEKLEQAGISCWYDEAEIAWGESITQKVNEGLRISRFVIVVLSPNFISKSWPQRELNAILNMEASKGESKVLPLIAASEQERPLMLDKYPLLNDRKYLSWDGNFGEVVQALQTRLSKENSRGISQPQNKNINFKMPLPQIKKHFNQSDKDFFLQESFNTVKINFKNGLADFQKQSQAIETNFMEINNYKFICKIYVRGEMSSYCKIWLGRMSSSDSICYQSNQFDINNDNSYNDLLFVSDDGQTLGFNPSNMWFGVQQHLKEELLSANQAAEYLWRRFTNNPS